MDNTAYEFFIRRAWKCDRFQKGADTDIWESVLVYKYEYENAIGQIQKEKAKKKYERGFAEIKQYIDNAYNRLLIRGQKVKLSIEAIEKIKLFKNKAEDSDTPEKLFNVMKESFNLMNDNKL